MRTSPSDLKEFLEALARSARPGDRLPTIRELMRRFGASQMVVQRAFQDLKDKGWIESQIGRGTYFLAKASKVAAAETSSPSPSGGGDGAAPATKSVLLLRRSISIARGRLLAEGLQRRFAEEGHRVLELSYTDPEHALIVLKGLPRFDACVVQSTYRTIPIALLAALKDRSDVLAVDGSALVGADVEAVGTEWGEPLAAAIALLQRQGHERIAFATTAHPFLATQLARRRFETLQQTVPSLDLQEIAIAKLPDEDYMDALVGRLQSDLGNARHLPFTGLVAWGIEDGARFRASLSGIGIEVPAALSVVLLGRTDLANEHANFFCTVGSSVADQVEGLHRAIHSRWADPSAPFSVCLTSITARAGESVAEAVKGPAARRAQR